ncbi:Aldehyde dehydrogenase [Borealophlyctis nickersoniae]|nr:Aldehyde dehydrogenase [Borealophlyctis nickersoniae]
MFKVVNNARKAFRDGVTRPLAWRKAQLRALYKMIDENEDTFTRAAYDDLRKHPTETFMADLMPVKNEIAGILAEIDHWVKPKRVVPGIVFALDRLEIRRDPYGLALVIGTWNYAYQLLLAPLAFAIAGGNSVVLKLSEVSVGASGAMARLIPKYMDMTAIKIVTGAVPETTLLLEQQFDIIFYTGNTMVGKIIQTAAAKHLTPAVLELGGKCPVIVAPDADVDILSKRVLWAKMVNAGQTCIAPDYILVPRKIAPALYAAIPKAYKELLSDKPREVSHYARIITDRHYDRLVSIMEKQRNAPGVRVIAGGDVDAKDKYIGLTVFAGVGKDATKNATMEDELFGPLLPIIEVEDVDEAIAYVNTSTKVIEDITARTKSGTMMGNDFLMNMLTELPFGGVGASGMGTYHGEAGFQAFTHARGVMIRPHKMEFLNMMRYPPFSYTTRGYQLIRLAMHKRPPGALGAALAPLISWGFKLFFVAALVVIGFVLGRIGRW